LVTNAGEDTARVVKRRGGEDDVERPAAMAGAGGAALVGQRPARINLVRTGGGNRGGGQAGKQENQHAERVDRLTSGLADAPPCIIPLCSHIACRRGRRYVADEPGALISAPRPDRDKRDGAHLRRCVKREAGEPSDKAGAAPATVTDDISLPACHW